MDAQYKERILCWHPGGKQRGRGRAGEQIKTMGQLSNACFLFLPFLGCLEAGGQYPLLIFTTKSMVNNYIGHCDKWGKQILCTSPRCGCIKYLDWFFPDDVKWRFHTEITEEQFPYTQPTHPYTGVRLVDFVHRFCPNQVHRKLFLLVAADIIGFGAPVVWRVKCAHAILHELFFLCFGR